MFLWVLILGLCPGGAFVPPFAAVRRPRVPATRVHGGVQENLSPGEWEARKRLAQNVSVGMRPPDDPMARKPVKSWEEEEREMSDAEIARRLKKALSKNREAERAANRKIITNWFAEGTEELLKEGERLKEEIALARPRLEAEARERTSVAEDALLSDIDRKIRDFCDRNKGLIAPLAAENTHAQTISRSEAVAAGLDKLLSGSGSPTAGPGRYGPPSRGTSLMAAGASTPTSLRQPVAEMREAVQPTVDSSRVVVVGSTGMIGAALLAQLSASYPVTGLDLSTLQPDALPPTAKEVLFAAETLILAPDQNSGGPASSGVFGRFLGRGGGGDGAAQLSERQVELLLDACGPSLQHVILLSSIGTNRANEFPFSVQNVRGALDEKRGVEQAVVRRSKSATGGSSGFDRTILRVGKLSAGEVAGKPAVNVLPGDQGSGETSREAAVEGLHQCLVQRAARNATASLLSASPPQVARGAEPWKPPVQQRDWDDEFLRLDGPELMRVSLSELMPNSAGNEVARAGIFLREWSNAWTRSGNGLSTPVAVSASDHRVVILFKPAAQDYVSSKEEREMTKQREREGGSGQSGGGSRPGRKEGGLEIVVENSPYPRIRVFRTPMDDGVVVKEMSEKLILERLVRDLKSLGKG